MFGNIRISIHHPAPTFQPLKIDGGQTFSKNNEMDCENDQIICVNHYLFSRISNQIALDQCLNMIVVFAFECSGRQGIFVFFICLFFWFPLAFGFISESVTYIQLFRFLSRLADGINYEAMIYD